MANDTYNWGVDLDALLPGDVSDAAKMQHDNPNNGTPWWQDLIKTGVTKLVDNAIQTRPQVQGNTDPGSFAGANGRTYSAEEAKRGSGQPLQGNPDAVTVVPNRAGASWSDMGMLAMAGIGLALFLALRK